MINSNYWYYLTNHKSGTETVLTVDGLNLFMRPYSKSGQDPSQLWRFENLPKKGKDWYQIYNKAVGPSYAVDSSQTNVFLANTGSFTGQYWLITNLSQLGPDLYRLTNEFITEAKSLDCIETEPVIGDRGTHAGQEWQFIRADRLILPDISTENIVKIQQSKYVLEKKAFHKGKHHLIYAATVEIGKGFKNPGCDLTIFTAQLIVPDGAEIDVSGSPGKTYTPGEKDGLDGVGHKDGVDGNDGKAGAEGKRGGDGGNVAIYAGRVTGGELKIRTLGGDGGRGQDGGNGVNGRGGDHGDDGKEAKVKEDYVISKHGYMQKIPIYSYPNRIKIGNYDRGKVLF